MFMFSSPSAEHEGWLFDTASVRFRGAWYTLDGGYNQAEHAIGLLVPGPDGSQTRDLEGAEVHAPYVGALGSLEGPLTWFYGVTVDQESGLPLRVLDPETGEDLQVRQDLE